MFTKKNITCKICAHERPTDDGRVIDIHLIYNPCNIERRRVCKSIQRGCTSSRDLVTYEYIDNGWSTGFDFYQALELQSPPSPGGHPKVTLSSRKLLTICDPPRTSISHFLSSTGLITRCNAWNIVCDFCHPIAQQYSPNQAGHPRAFWRFRKPSAALYPLRGSISHSWSLNDIISKSGVRSIVVCFVQGVAWQSPPSPCGHPHIS